MTKPYSRICSLIESVSFSPTLSCSWEFLTTYRDIGFGLHFQQEQGDEKSKKKSRQEVVSTLSKWQPAMVPYLEHSFISRLYSAIFVHIKSRAQECG